MPFPAMYHFTHVVPAAQAVGQGLIPQVTPNDPLQEAGVWLSPNVYGMGSEGSFFGPIGLRVAPAHLAGCACVYVGPNPRYQGRHRFLLLPHGIGLPAAVQQQNAPPGLPNATTPCELLLLRDVPAGQIDGVVFGDKQGMNEDEAQLEHARFFGRLVAEQHRLLAAIPHPHSTREVPYGGWWTFRHLRNLLEEEAQGGATPTTAAMQAVLSRMVTHGLGGRAGLSGLSAQAVRQWLTTEYAAAFQNGAGTPLDLSADR